MSHNPSDKLLEETESARNLFQEEAEAANERADDRYDSSMTHQMTNV